MKMNYWFIGSCVCLALLFVLPLWKISLVVPQYPKDIGIYLHINKIADVSPKALKILNVLNHNIGMKEIDPEEFKELKIFPLVVIGFIVTGLALSFFVQNQSFHVTWSVVLLLASAAAMADFYYWLYDFGHDLDPGAALQIEGQSFQPPLLGIRKVMNLEVHSFPHWGALSGILAIGLAFIGSSKRFNS